MVASDDLVPVGIRIRIRTKTVATDDRLDGYRKEQRRLAQVWMPREVMGLGVRTEG